MVGGCAFRQEQQNVGGADRAADRDNHGQFWVPRPAAQCRIPRFWFQSDWNRQTGWNQNAQICLQ